MTARLPAFKSFTLPLGIALAMAAATCAADQVTGPSLSPPRVNKDAEFVAPPLVLPAANQNEVDPEFATQPPIASPAAAAPAVADPGLAGEGSAPVARPEPPHLVHRPVEVEVIAPPVPVVAVPSQAVYEPIYKELPVTNHIMHIGARRFARCQRGMTHAKLEVTNPAECDGCCYWVSAQVPACCEGEPIRSGRVGILGRGVVEYRWSCGWTVKVVFRTRGDVVLHYMAG